MYHKKSQYHKYDVVKNHKLQILKLLGMNHTVLLQAIQGSTAAHNAACVILNDNTIIITLFIYDSQSKYMWNITKYLLYMYQTENLTMINFLRPLLCTQEAKLAEQPPKVMK